MIVKVTIHEKMTKVRPNGVGDRHLRRNLWLRSLKIYFQSGINELILGGMVGFEFKLPYKLQVATQQKTLVILRIELLRSHVHMNCEFFQDLIASPAFEQLSKETQGLVKSIMSTHAESVYTEGLATEENV